MTGHAVASVYFSFDNENEICLSQERGKLIKTRYHLTQKLRYFREKYTGEQMNSSLQSKMENMSRERMKIGSRIKDINNYLKSTETKSLVPVSIFVTFEETAGATVAKKLYTRSLLGFYSLPEFLKFKNVYFVVNAAQEPSTIIWENLKYSWSQRAFRRFLTTCVACVLLAISFAVTAVSHSASVVYSGSQNPCPSDWTSRSSEDQLALAKSDSSILHCYCDPYGVLHEGRVPECRSYFYKRMEANMLVAAAALVVLCINSMFESVLKVFSGLVKINDG